MGAISAFTTLPDHRGGVKIAASLLPQRLHLFDALEIFAFPFWHIPPSISIGPVLKSNKQVRLPQWCRVLIFLGAMVFHAEMTNAGALAAPIASYVEPELLEPERAFQLSARQKDAKNVELLYKIADGYFLYANRFRFAIEPNAGAKLGKVQLSKGKMKLDPTFGWVKTYRNSVRILLPVTRSHKNDGSTDSPLRLTIISQGCADAGVCYPPLQQTLTLAHGNSGVVMANRTGNVNSLKEPLQSTPDKPPSTPSELLRKTK